MLATSSPLPPRPAGQSGSTHFLCRQPCELFVPRVKESQVCSVCGYTLVDHNVTVFDDPPTSSLNSEPVIYRPSPVRYSDVTSSLTPSRNSAFSQYRRLPGTQDASSSVGSVDSDMNKIGVSPSNSTTQMELHSPARVIYSRPIPVIKPYPTDNPPLPQIPEKTPRKTRQRRKERSVSARNPDSVEATPDKTKNGVNSSEPPVRPQNFKELLHRFQSAAGDDDNAKPRPFPQRFNSVRVSSKADKSRRATIVGDESSSQNTTASMGPYLRPSPLVKLRAFAATPSAASDGGHRPPVPPSRRRTIQVNCLRPEAPAVHDDDDDDFLPRSSPEDDPSACRIYAPVVTVTTETPKSAPRASTFADSDPPSSQFSSPGTGAVYNLPSPIVPLTATTTSSDHRLGYMSGSDSGYPRGHWSSSHDNSTPSLDGRFGSVRSNPDSRAKAAEDLYNQMTVQHTNTLAFLIDNFADIVKLHTDVGTLSKNFFDDLSLDSIELKNHLQLVTKSKLVFFEAAVVGPDYAELPLTVMLAPTCQYIPLMGKFAERTGFCPTVLFESEEPESVVARFLDAARVDPYQRASVYRLVIMPQLSLCSLHSLVARNVHKTADGEQYEHHVTFIMLQLLAALKVLQSDGVEVLSNNFKEFLLAYPISEPAPGAFPKLMLLRETMDDEYKHQTNAQERVGVCRYALRALCTLLNHKMTNHTVPRIEERTDYSAALQHCAELLHLDRSSSLTEAKHLLEFAFFCPRASFVSEYDAKLWLDERRAHQVNRTVRLLADRSEGLCEARERVYIQFLLSVTPHTLFATYQRFRACKGARHN